MLDLDDNVVIVVPDRHPLSSLAGAPLTLYPNSGATTYTEGTVTVRTASQHALIERLQGVQEEISALRQRWGQHSSKEARDV